MKIGCIMKKISFLGFLLAWFVSSASCAESFYSHNRFISYTEVGEGLPLVLIHAFPTDKRLWTAQQEGLKKHFRVISLDLWGFGESSSVNGGAVSMQEYAEEVKELLKHLHIQKAIIGGESMGGYIALAFLEHYPKQIEGLILANTQALADSPETKALREKTAVEVLEQGTEQFIQGFINKTLSPNASEETRAFLTHILSLQKPTAIASALRGMALRQQTLDVLAKTELPVLIISSDQDNIISSQRSLEMHELAKNSRLVIINNSGHLANIEQAEQWNRAVLEMFF